MNQFTSGIPFRRVFRDGSKLYLTLGVKVRSFFGGTPNARAPGNQHAATSVSMQSGRTPGGFATLGKRDIAFCAFLTIVASVIFLVGKSWSVPVFSNMVAFDGKYYLDIAKNGYHFSGLIQERQSISFFPLEALAIDLARWVLPGENDSLKITFLGALALFGTLLGIHVLLGERGGKQAARLAALLWAFSPLAFYNFVGYTEPLFALGTVWCLIALRRRCLWGASVIAGIAMLGRPQAIVLVLFTAVELLASTGWRPWRLLKIGPMLKLVTLAAPLMALATWMVLRFDDSFIYVNAGAAWRHYYNSAGNFLPFFQAIEFFMRGIGSESPALTHWKVMLGSVSMLLVAVTLMLSFAASKREAMMYLAFIVFLGVVVSFDVSNFARHTLYLVPWVIITGAALAQLPGKEWQKHLAIMPVLALFTLINLHAVMRFFRWEWVS